MYFFCIYVFFCINFFKVHFSCATAWTVPCNFYLNIQVFSHFFEPLFLIPLLTQRIYYIQAFLFVTRMDLFRYFDNVAGNDQIYALNYYYQVWCFSLECTVPVGMNTAVMTQSAVIHHALETRIKSAVTGLPIAFIQVNFSKIVTFLWTLIE